MAKGHGGVRDNQGRPKGSPNKDTAVIRGFFTELVKGEIDNIKNALEEIRVASPAQYIKLLLEMSEYCIPKLQRIEITDDLELEEHDFEDLTDAEVVQLDTITAKTLDISRKVA